MDVLCALRAACAAIAGRARHVHLQREAIEAYAASLDLDTAPAGPDPDAHLLGGTREERAAYWLTLDAVNFGSGWFPTLRKRAGMSGYFTIATGLRQRFIDRGAWSAHELAMLDARAIAEVLGQDPAHELMELFARSLNDLGIHLARDHDSEFCALVERAGGSAVALVELLSRWDSFGDTSGYGQIRVPFLKRAQIAAADLASAGVAELRDLERLTMFADNLVPHVLRLDDVLRFETELVERIERQELIDHGSREEVEIRACAVHAVELIVAARPGARPAEIDKLLWQRGQEPRYKSRPRHRSRCTAY